MDNDHGITSELRTEARGRGKYIYISEQARHLLAIADRIDAEHQKAIRELNNLADASVLLPVDADGEYIHIGDMVADINEGKPFTLEEATLNKLGWTLSGSAYGEMYEPTQCRHYHAPTVEDVLCELLDKVDDDRAGQAEIIAEYAAKLRLAGDAE